MIRALLFSICLAAPAFAQTPAATSVANDLRACIAGPAGFRGATEIGYRQASLDALPNRKWTNVTEIAPGVFRLNGASGGITIEIKLPDASGAAHCVAFGPALVAGQGGLSADKFVELGFLDGLAPAPAAQGMTRRYTLAGASHAADLVAYATKGGEFVGFVFNGVPQDRKMRALSSADPAITSQSVRAALANAVDICLRNYFSRETRDAALSTHGFEFAYATGGKASKDIYFTGDNAVSVLVSPGTCEVETNYIGPAGAAQVAGDVLNVTAPGIFSYHVEKHDGCPSYYQDGRLDPPVFLNIRNMKRTGNTGCVEDGTARIILGVAG
jgi:hypothetical protein